MPQSQNLVDIPESIAESTPTVELDRRSNRLETRDKPLFQIEHDDDETEASLADCDLQEPSRESQLSAYETMLLYYYLNTQLYETGQAPLLASGQPRPIYDWFVNALNVAPLCDWLFSYLNKLARWERTTKHGGSANQNGQCPSSEIPKFTEWQRLPGIKV
ncbi:hypothetical protein AB1L42_01595 [Thalassoglobus sp. JC818]|uniref:hypothetical protein n=1 Tax=Thalassoglobus sp. JC818 TaxID=3232136 RepID=UPI003459EC6A